MKPRKILLVTYHFPPSAASGAFRMLGFAKHLPKFGWQSLIVAPPELPWEPVDRRLVEQVPPDTKVYHAPYPRHWFKALRWAAPYAVWLPMAKKACRQAVEAERPDVVLTSGPPHWAHLLGLFLKKKYQLPWLADFRDPWISAGDQPAPTSLGTWWQKRWEAKVLRHADRVLANAPFACEKMRQAFPAQADKIVSLTNGFDPIDDLPPAPHPAGSPLRLVHAGQIYSGRDPRPLLDAVAGLRQTQGMPALAVEFLGRNAGHGVDLKAEISLRGLAEVVRVRAQVPYGQSLQIMRGADILLLLDSPGRRVGVPAKLYEYLGAGRAVLALAEPDGDTARVLRASGLPHALARPSDAAAIATGLRSLVEKLAEGSLPAPEPDNIQRFTREHLAGQLGELLNEVLGISPVADPALCLAGCVSIVVEGSCWQAD